MLGQRVSLKQSNFLLHRLGSFFGFLIFVFKKKKKGAIFLPEENERESSGTKSCDVHGGKQKEHTHTPIQIETNENTPSPAFQCFFGTVVHSYPSSGWRNADWIVNMKAGPGVALWRVSGGKTQTRQKPTTKAGKRKKIKIKYLRIYISRGKGGKKNQSK